MRTSLRSYALRSLIFTILFFVYVISTPAAPGAKTAAADQQEAPQTAQKSVNLQTQIQTADDEADDPDMPALSGGSFDKEDYLRMRDEYIARIRGIDPSNPRDPSMRMNAIRAMELQEQRIYRMQRESAAPGAAGGISPFAPASATTWMELGPDPIPNGQTNGTSVPVSGRVAAIAVHPTNPNIIYVGAAQGGVYRSLDGGATWTPLMDNALTLAIGAIAIDPLNPSTVFVGTGEGDRSLDSFFGVGLYRIDNADTNPVLSGPFETRVAGTGTAAGNGHSFLGTSITKIVVDPADDNRIFVGNTLGASGLNGAGICCNGTNPPSGSLGLFFSGNAMSANPVFSSVAIAPTDPFIAVTDIVMEPGSSDNMLIGIEDFMVNRPNSGIYRTTNASTASQSPSISPTFTPTFPLTGQALNIKFAMNKVGGVVTTLAATSASNGTVMASPDGGVTWPTTIAAATGFCAGQCFYDMVVTLKPDDPNTFFLGGQAGSLSLKKTIDGGNTFTSPIATLHADTHVIVFAPSDFTVMYEGNDGGIWRSGDGGSTWTSRNTAGFSATQFQSLALHPLDREFMIGGTQDNGTEFKKPDGSWLRADGGDGGYTLVDQNATDTTNVTMYHTYFNSSGSQIGYAHHTGPLPGSWFLSGCFGAVSRNGITCTDRVLFYAPMARGPGSPNSIYFGSDRLYRSADGGTSNVVVSQAPIMTSTGVAIPISTIAISPQNDNVRIVGLTNGKVFATTTGSLTLTDITGSLPARYVARAVVDPNNQNTAYVTFDTYAIAPGQHVWKTTDLNDAAPVWTASGNGIPNVPTNSIVVDPLDSNSVYAATDIGVYHSSDGGASWNPYGTGLPRVACFDIAIQNPNRVLRVATHGRGIWEIATAPVATTTTMLSSQNPSVFGQSVTFTATVSVAGGSATPTGTVQFQDGGANLGSPVTLSGGTATFTTSSLFAGTHNITAVYSGDVGFSGSTGSLPTQTVNQANTSTTVISDNNPSLFGQTVTFTATVSAVAPGSGTPTGAVTFLDGASSIGTGTLDGSGHATLATSTLSVGAHNITAQYAGDANFNPSTGSLPTQTVNQANTSTTVTSDNNPSAFGQAVTFTATVSAVAPASGTPTGAVTFLDGANNIGTGTLDGSGHATFTTSILSIGAHNITAVYNGDANFTASTGSLPTQTVNHADTSTSVSSNNNPSIFGQPVTFTATVSVVAPGSGSATGTVTFFDNASNIGSGPLDGSGHATLTTSALSAGTHNITAHYGGDGNFNASIGSLPTQTVNQASTTTAVTSNHNPSVFGQPVTFSATVASGAGIPTGTVQFLDGGANLGPPVALSSGLATLTTASLSAGAHNITAVYSGDTNFTGSTGSLPTQMVNQAGSATAINSSLNPSNFGQPVTFTATVSSAAGTLSGAVQFLDGSGSLGPPVILSGGLATFTTSSLTVGTHSITALYSGDGNFSASTSPVLTQIVHGTDIAVTLTHHPRIAVVGGRLTFVATVTNNGPESANVSFTEQFTGRFLLVRARASSGSCTISGGQVSCTLGLIHTGSHVTVRVRLIPLRPASAIAATATATPDIGDTVPANNTATDSAKVRSRHFDDDDRDDDDDDDDRDHDD